MSSTNDPDGTIPVTTAKEWAENWRIYLATATTDFVTRSFLIPIIDFQNILLYNPNAESVRAYLGLEDAQDVTSVKLMLVPVNEGEEVHYVSVGSAPGEPKSNVYDFTTSCPPTCGSGVGDTLEDA